MRLGVGLGKKINTMCSMWQTNIGWNRVWVSAIFFVKKIPKGRQEIKKWFLDSKFQKLPKIQPPLFFEEHVVTALYIGYCFNDPLGMCRQRRQNIIQDACKCVRITKLNENKISLSAALNHITTCLIIL
jgi:hypothetical protein